MNAAPKPEEAKEFKGKRWVVLCAAAGGYGINYAFQASVYHAYHLLKNHGIPEENIIVMHPDDLAYNKQNPTQGIVVNQVKGPDVYHDVPKHYVKDDITPKTFLSVISGDPKLKAAGKKVVESGPDDHIFVFLFDHGATELVAFRKGQLFAKDLKNTLVQMHEDKKFAKMLFYLEACESGSMFDGILPDNINVYAAASSRPDEPSYPCCNDPIRHVGVGGLFSDAWYRDSETKDLNTETIAEQFTFIAKEIKGTEHSVHYGDESIGKMTLAEFFGPKKVIDQSLVSNVTRNNEQCQLVNQRELAVWLAEKNIQGATNVNDKLKYTQELELILNGRQYADKQLNGLFETLKPLTGLEAIVALNTRSKVNNRECYYKFVQTFDEQCFNLNNNPYFTGKLHAFVNVCESLPQTSAATDSAIELMVQYCQQNANSALNIQ
ncbi:unnamed protein product [Medioppia subpectinata]|uniref:Legumain prodomain domain-containing protein n=1 Tax=Medioppia subpectinata TaxID=1979941 RepID=A0A7R9L634_9ACAR|nr:unnamed protein product [Medioppia subpectinata]CAG2115003.1 unnamed protein product [Medioppia subpectinata]